MYWTGFEDLHTGDAVTLSLNCSSATLMPIITLETVESFSVNLGMLSVNYICNSSDAQVRLGCVIGRTWDNRLDAKFRQHLLTVHL